MSAAQSWREPTTRARTYINRYDEYGKPQSGNQGRFQYTGQVYLNGAGLYHYKARVYDPELGRFLQTDPIGYVASMNLYAYVGNDPMNFNDPFGLDEFELRRGRETWEPMLLHGWHREIPLAPPRRTYPIQRTDTTPQPSPFGIEYNRAVAASAFSQPSVFDAARQYAFAATISIDGAFGGLVPDILLDLADSITPVANIVEGVSDGHYLGAAAMTGLAAVRVRGKIIQQVKEFLGYGNPTKLNRGGRLQPYDAVTGRFLPYSANPGLANSQVAWRGASLKVENIETVLNHFLQPRYRDSFLTIRPKYSPYKFLQFSIYGDANDPLGLEMAFPDSDWSHEYVPILVQKGDPPALPGRQYQFDNSLSLTVTPRREPPSTTPRSNHETNREFKSQPLGV